MNNEQLEARWFENVRKEVPGPVLASMICDLGSRVNDAVRAAKEMDWKAYFDAILRVCYESQRIRLYVGNLFRMHHAGREKFREAMTIACQSFVEKKLIFPKSRDEYQEAVKNIEGRMNMTTEENFELVLAD